MKLKVGDSLYCYNNIIKGDVYGEIDFTIGTIYTIYNINDNFLSATLKAFEHLKVDLTYIWVIDKKTGKCFLGKIMNFHILHLLFNTTYNGRSENNITN